MAGMEHGLAIFLTDYSIGAAELARAAEERGFESLWTPEHSHIPASRRTPFPGGGDLPKMYYDVMDPFVTLSAAAAVTTKLKLATGICLVVQRDPIQTAKSVASLDRVSNGRFLFGVGGGWNVEEMENHGTDAAKRWRVMRERIEAMKAIWTEKEAEYHGEHVDFDPIFAWPKPVQRPHPPIHVAGAYPGGARRAARYGDGWVPIAPGRKEVREQIEGFRKLCQEAGRPELPVTIFGSPPRAENVADYRSAGAARVVFFLPPAGRDQVLPLLDQYAALAQAG
jgi:probable F420-dependent oxidoreductase